MSGARVVEIFAQDADDSSPLVIWLHGRGESPERFVSLWTAFPGKIEVALPQAPLPAGDGWSRYDWPDGMSDDALAGMVASAEEKLWPVIVEIAHGRRVIVGGFSQGAVLSYVLAARHPDAVA